MEETRKVSETLRSACDKYEKLKDKNRTIEAKTYIPIIVKCCELLGVNWKVLLEIENGFFLNVSDKLSDTLSDTADTLSDTADTLSDTTDTLSDTLSDTTDTLSDTTDTDSNRYKIYNCQHCNGPMKGKRAGTKFCSGACKTAFNRKKTA